MHKQVGRYELIEFLGRGGMADVYLARVVGLADFKRLFAVKMIRSDLPEWSKFGNFFIDEARITVHLQHPNIVQVFDLGMCDTGPYLGMEYVDGPDLRQVIARSMEMRGGVPFNLAIYVAREVLQGLAYAHEAATPDGAPMNIAHRDISPSNILLTTTGAVKLSDFGVAAASIATQAQEEGAIVGKAHYFAPEVARGEGANQQSDLFSLGVVLFDLFLGRPLVQADVYTDIVEELKGLDIEERISEIYSLPTEFEEFFRRALANDLDDRFPDARSMLDHLEDYMYSTGVRVTAADMARYLADLEDYALRDVPPFDEYVTAASYSTGVSWRSQSSGSGSGASFATAGDSATEATDGKDATVVSAHDKARVRRSQSMPGLADLTPEEDGPALPGPSPIPNAPPRRKAREIDAGSVLVLPEAQRVTLFQPGLGPLEIDEDEFDRRLEDERPAPDTLLSFDGGEIRPFHEWVRMGNPRAGIRAEWSPEAVDPLKIGPALIRLASRTGGTCTIQLFDGRQVIGLIVEDGWFEGVWTEDLNAEPLSHLMRRGAVSKAQYEVVRQLAEGDHAELMRLALQHEIIGEASLWKGAREIIRDHVRRALGWPFWRVNRIPCPGGGWGRGDAGVEARETLLDVGSEVFNLDWFLGLAPDMERATIRFRQRQQSGELDRLLGKGQLRVARDLKPGTPLSEAIVAPSGEPDSERARNLYDLLLTGVVELGPPTARRAAPAGAGGLGV